MFLHLSTGGSIGGPFDDDVSVHGRASFMLQLGKPLPMMLRHQSRFPAGPTKREVHSILIQGVSELHRFTGSISNSGCGLRRSITATVTIGGPVQCHDCHDAMAWIPASEPPD